MSFHRVSDRPSQKRVREIAFVNIILGTTLYRSDSEFTLVSASKNDNRNRRGTTNKPIKCFDTTTIRQIEVKQHDIWSLCVSVVDRFGEPSNRREVIQIEELVAFGTVVL
ncbi:hypothetical protein C495_17272 [Natronorubrum sulfidifaciens JCM 14089]|uniref:Uncharacterized protein n=1 Tax=Natronorubrum sulfidifaciens JCM 14089 TaxID=1230460 RepID=L9VUI6_9EURY|nr:hypothetical protein C495_17272 [Natronorubrum sulfidifaciens JCM 14089]